MKKSYFTVASNTLYQILGRFVSALAAVLITRMLTGSLGIEGYGSYQIILTYASFLWILTDFGLNAVAVRRMAAEPKREQAVFSALLTCRLALGLVLTLGLCIATFFLPYETVIKFGIWLCAITVVTQALRGACSGIFQLKLRYDLQFIAETVGSIFYLGAIYFVLNQNWGLEGVAGAFVLQYLLVAVLFYLFSRRWVQFKINTHLFVGDAYMRPLQKTGREGGNASPANEAKIPFEAISLAREAFPFGIALLFSLLISKVDTFLLSIIPQESVSQIEAVGHYNLGFKLFEFVLAVPVFFMNVVYPILVKNLALKKEFFLDTLKKSFLILLNLSVWGSMALYLIAPYLIRIFAKDIDIGPAVQVLRNMTLFTPVFFITALLMWVLVVFKKQRALIYIYASAFIFSLTLNYLFIPHYSYLAPSVVKGLTEVIILVQLSFVAAKSWQGRKMVTR